MLPESQCHNAADVTQSHNVTGSSGDDITVLPSGPSTPAISEDTTDVKIHDIDGWGNNADLRVFWASGMGTPHPLSYHPDIEVAHDRGLADFKKAEEEYIDKNCPSEDSLKDQISPPVCPMKPTMPGLYHLKEIGVDVALPWTWDCSSGGHFVEEWEVALKCADFKMKLMQLVYWWTCRKVS